MHQHPFTLIRVVVLAEGERSARTANEAGEPVFQRPLWLLVIGQQREEVIVLPIIWTVIGDF